MKGQKGSRKNSGLQMILFVRNNFFFNEFNRKPSYPFNSNISLMKNLFFRLLRIVGFGRRISDYQRLEQDGQFLTVCILVIII